MLGQYVDLSYRSHYLIGDAEQLRFAILLLALPNLLFLGYDLWPLKNDSTPSLTIALRLLFLLVSAWVWWLCTKPQTPGSLDRLSLVWAGMGMTLLIGNAWARPADYFGHYLFEVFALLMFFAVVPLPPRYKLALALLYLMPSLGILFLVKQAAQSPLLPGTAFVLPLSVFCGYLVALRIENYRRAAFQATQELETIARTDPLTAVANRRAFMQWADRELARTARTEGQELSVLLLDLDHFKHVNDRYGHAVGDKVLIEFCRRIEESLRRYDLLARMGGEEFVVGLPRCGLADAVQAAERIRLAVSDTPFNRDQEAIVLTVSIGVACLHPGESEIDGALGRADQAMYEAKRTGRNKVCVEDALSRPEVGSACGQSSPSSANDAEGNQPDGS